MSLPSPVVLPSLMFLEFSRTPFSMTAAGAVLLVIGMLGVKKDFAQARGLEKVITLSNLCFAIPLAVFGALHLSAAPFLQGMIPAYFPWRLFLAYFVGVALIAAALSIATKIGVEWSGLLFGIMMFIFDATIHIPGVFRDPHNRIVSTIVLREASFGAGGWVFAGNAMQRWNAQGKGLLVNIGRVIIAIAAIVFGVLHFLHPLGLPGVPLEKEIPTWIPLRPLIDYLTGALLVGCGLCMLIGKKVRLAAGWLGAFLLLEVVVIYGPVLILSLLDPSSDVKVVGINYFADTLLFTGAILSVAAASRQE